MQADFPFQPVNGAANTVSQAVTATSAQIALTGNIPADGGTLLLTNIGTQTVFVAYGTTTASVTTSMPLLANTAQTISAHPRGQNLSVIAAATGSTLYVTFGSGV